MNCHSNQGSPYFLLAVKNRLTKLFDRFQYKDAFCRDNDSLNNQKYFLDELDEE